MANGVTVYMTDSIDDMDCLLVIIAGARVTAGCFDVGDDGLSWCRKGPSL